LQRNHGIERTLADHHAAGMLAEMPRQILQAHTQIQILGDAMVAEVKASVVEVTVKSIVGAAPLPAADQRGETVQRLHVKPKHLADLARGQASAIGADIGGHSGAALAVSPIQILDGLLALVAAGEIEIYVRPLAAFFR